MPNRRTSSAAVGLSYETCMASRLGALPYPCVRRVTSRSLAHFQQNGTLSRRSGARKTSFPSMTRGSISMFSLPSPMVPCSTAIVSVARILFELCAVPRLSPIHALVCKLHQIFFLGVAPHRSDPCGTMHCSHCCQDLRLDTCTQSFEHELGFLL